MSIAWALSIFLFCMCVVLLYDHARVSKLLNVKTDKVKDYNMQVNVLMNADEAKKELELIEAQTNRIQMNILKINASILEGKHEYGRAIEKTSGKTAQNTTGTFGYGS